MTVRVHTAAAVRDYPTGVRFSTEDEFNNLCVWGGRSAEELLAVFADGQWVLVEFTDG